MVVWHLLLPKFVTTVLLDVKEQIVWSPIKTYFWNSNPNLMFKQVYFNNPFKFPRMPVLSVCLVNFALKIQCNDNIASK